jgi:4-hydroxy-2-oxoheptanedioate aldolase
MKDIKKALQNGEVVIGVCNDISDPCVVEILGYSRWDFVIINCEGGTISPFGGELENQIRAAYHADIYPIVKVPKNDPGFIATALNYGAKMLEIPNVSTREDAIAAVKAAKFPPQGERAVCWGIPATKYGTTIWSEYISKANDEIGVYAVLENEIAMNNMEDIVSVEGIDILSIGKLDAALRFGGIGNPKAEQKVLEYRKKLAPLANANGKTMLMSVSDFESAKGAVALGCRVLLFGQDDISMLFGESSKWETQLRKIIRYRAP